MPEPIIPTTAPMPRMITITIVIWSPATTIASKPESSGNAATPAVQRLLTNHSPHAGDDAADQALDQTLEHERDADEPVGRADELHHLDLASSGEHRRADRVPDQQHGREHERDRETGRVEPDEALQLGDQVDLVLGELDGVDVRQIVGTSPSSARRVSTSVPSFGTILNWVGMLVSSSSSREVGSPASTRSASASEHSTSQYVVRLDDDATLLVELVLDDGALLVARLGADVHDHLDAALPLDEQVVEAVLDQQRETEDQQRDGRRDDRRHRQGHVALEARPGLPERVHEA